MRASGGWRIWSGVVVGAALLLMPGSGVVQTQTIEATGGVAHDARSAAAVQSADRRKHLQEDVNRLVTLSNELKAEMDKTTKNEMSLGVLRKAAEIEKLAHEAQSRMKS